MQKEKLLMPSLFALFLPICFYLRPVWKRPGSCDLLTEQDGCWGGGEAPQGALAPLGVPVLLLCVSCLCSQCSSLLWYSALCAQSLG